MKCVKSSKKKLKERTARKGLHNLMMIMEYDLE